ncbi:NAD(P)/FAD-dependent oxidoreductase [Thalassococcus sp. S3]|uniref:flavin-containing monooxygenase n=1 Tax=Thalassococcus sp. S3 TaxID=2017482 RepID=UPI00102468A3|nr:NAD(P)/FAD-dependent oxidoreductase [Thalassococcus sp. S3]QBF29735.1 FAD-containing monooxygenase EthA [Thalassococcus sp. S3]
MSKTKFDVLIIGAGISGIGLAYYLQKRCPEKSFTILEGRDAIGGTWDLFRYPGIRSDSDMHTLGFTFKPWDKDRVIVDGATIRDYVEEAAHENGIYPKIRFRLKVTDVSWSSQSARWTVTAIDQDTGTPHSFIAQYLFMGTGYYSYRGGYTPDFKGQDDYAGQIVHPQTWPADLDYSGKRVVVIGSGATAMSIVPEMAGRAAHVTMLQRSPTYVVSRPAEDPLAKVLNRILPKGLASRLARYRNVRLQQYFFRKAREEPDAIKAHLRKLASNVVSTDILDAHFTPSYNPWEQRLCLIPDNDLFNALNDGSASVVTDDIDRFTQTGIALASGAQLEADMIVTATGLELEHLGGIAVEVDGQRVRFNETWSYKGVGYSGVPNMISSFGYFNASWTMRVELIAEYICRLIKRLDADGADAFTPVLDPKDADMVPRPWIDGFSSGYLARGNHVFPKQGDRAPWVHTQSYDEDRKLFLKAPLLDPELHLSSAKPEMTRREGVAAS